MNIKDIPHAEVSVACSEPLKPGDYYVAQRNGPARLLECRLDDVGNRWVVANSIAYPYDRHECFAVTKETYHKFAAQAESEFREWQAAFFNKTK